MDNDRGDNNVSSRSTCVLVLGMHRSGTSALTRVLNLLGAELPGNLMPARPSNEKGFWESLDIQRLNDDLLAALSTRWDDPVSVSTEQLPPAQRAAFHDRAARLLARDFSGSQLFVLKDPRVCRLFPFWRDALSEYGCELKVIIPFREPLDVSASLMRRNEMDATKAQVLWLHHMLHAEYQSRTLPRAILPFDELIQDWRASLRTIATRLNLTFPTSWEEASPEIDAFLDPSLRHHHTPANDHDAPATELIDDVSKARKNLLRLAKNGRDRGAYSALDKLREQFSNVEHLFSASILEARRHALTLAERVAAQQKELDETRSSTATSVAELEGLRSAEQRVTEDLRSAETRHQEELHRWHQTVTELADGLAKRDQLLEQRQEQLQLVESQLTLERKLVRNAEHRLQTLSRARLNDLQHPSSGPYGATGRTVRTLLSPLPVSKIQRELLSLGKPPTKRLNTGSGQVFSTFHWLRLAQRLLTSGLFDSRWFLLTATDCDRDGLHPVWQWLGGGWRQRADPNPLFDTRWYLMNAEEVRERDVDPLVHYLLRGAREHRSPSPLFDAKWFVAKCSDVGLKQENALSHFLQNAMQKARAPNPLLDPGWYRAFYPDVSRSGLSATEHFVLLGGPMGRHPSRHFDSRWYWEHHTDVAEHGMIPLAHYLAYGKSEKRAIRKVQTNTSLQAASNDGGVQQSWYPGKIRVDSDAAKALWLTDRHVEEAHNTILNSDAVQFSIIMPTWNRRESISRAIDSVVAQSYSTWELIICDDGSTDNTREWVEENYAPLIQKGAIRVLDLAHNGVSAARNAGLREAKGEWVAYLDSDNRWHPHFLLMMAANIKRSGKGIHTAYAALHVQMQDLSQEFIRARPFDWSHLLQGNYIDLNIFAHSRKLYEDMGGFDENLNRLVDWDLILRFTRQHPPIFVPHILADYYIAKSLNNITLTRPLSENERQIRRKHVGAQAETTATT